MAVSAKSFAGFSEMKSSVLSIPSTFLLLLCGVLPNRGADSGADDTQVRAAIQSLISELQQSETLLVNEFSARLLTAQDEHLKKLKALAQSAVAEGDAVGARTAWLEVLRLRRSDPEAREFFVTFQSLDTVLEELHRDEANPEKAPISSRRTWATQTKEHGRFIRFRHLGGKKWIQYFYDGKRWPCTERRRTEGFIEISNDELDQVFRLHEGKYYQSDRQSLKKNLWADGEEGSWNRVAK